ncbi:hypothetical protein AGMMS4956_17360 [Bacteroidia bacterium]|nr:hypothetical protein AGMMS4956_17360 [Bacteroidia bacterium]
MQVNIQYPSMFLLMMTAKIPNEIAIKEDPISNKGLRPILSIKNIEMMVNKKLMQPIKTV